MQRTSNTYLLLAILLLAFLVRFIGLDRHPDFQGDEPIHVPAAVVYHMSGHNTPESWFQPPLRNILLYSSMQIFGNNPYGWRMRNVIFGTLSVLILFLIAQEAFNNFIISSLSALMLAVEPLHITLSRLTYSEIPAVCLFLLAMLGTLLYARNGKAVSLLLTGVFLGLSLAIKWYYLPAIFILMIFALTRRIKKDKINPIDTIFIILCFTLLPLCIYMLTFYQWFGRGYDVSEFIRMQFNAYVDQQSLTASFYPERFRSIMGNTAPSEWFIKPVIVGLQLSRNGILGSYEIYMNNFIIWLFAFPILGFSVYHVIKTRNSLLFLFAAIFLSLYLPFGLLQRPIWFYSSLTIIPFLYLMATFLFFDFIRNKSDSTRYYYIALIFLTLWGVYLAPLVTCSRVPVFLYEPLLSLGSVLP